ncbi:hypothetical protein ACIA5A_13180 [Micromonospora sp. NPDC051300]|uniref:hypothetical protein n=1 Tax=Micromonospora sp. NPDC051300 TaxID=3364286 RepID=UPI0037ADF563
MEPADDGRDLRRDLAAVDREPNTALRLSASPIAQLILGTLPYAGGIGSTLAGRMQQRREERLRRFLLDLVADLEGLRTRQESVVERVDSEEYAELLHDTLEQVIASRDQERLAFLRRFLVAGSLDSRPDEGWIDIFFRYITRLSGAHLVVLRSIFDRQRNVAPSDRLGRRRLKNVPVGLTDLRTQTYQDGLLRVCLADLANNGLLVDWRTLSGESGFQEEYCLTRNGFLFMRFLEPEWEVTGAP